MSTRPYTISTLEHDETGLKVVDRGPFDDYATAVAEAERLGGGIYVTVLKNGRVLWTNRSDEEDE